MINAATVAEFTRANTGAHFLDSGDAYGRIHETPPPVGQFSVDEWAVSITLTGLLSEHATMMEDIQRQLDERDDLGNFERGPEVMEELGYECLARDNTYNSPNDLDQNFVWEVWAPIGSDDGEWLYSEDAVILIYAHTGCDVRGGYAPPIAVQFEDCEYVLPVCLNVSFDAANEETAEWMDESGFYPEEFSEGYSSEPQYRLRDAVGEYVSHDPESQEITFENPDHCPTCANGPKTLTFSYSHWV